MKRTGLGEFEELILLSICVLDNRAYSLSVKQEVEKRTNRSINISAIQTTLYRMEDKGLLESEFGETNSTRGGKRKRMFSATAYGLKSLSELRKLKNGLWADIPSVILKAMKS